MLGQRKLISLEECINWCNEEELCLAVAVSPSYWAYRECFRVTITDISFRAGWSAAYKSCFGTPPPGYYSESRGVSFCLRITDYTMSLYFNEYHCFCVKLSLMSVYIIIIQSVQDSTQVGLKWQQVNSSRYHPTQCYQCPVIQGTLTLVQHL